MTLSKTILRVLAVGAILSSAIPGAWSQTKPAGQTVKKPAVKSSSAKPETKAAAKATTKPTTKATAKVSGSSAACPGSAGDGFGREQTRSVPAAD